MMKIKNEVFDEELVMSADLYVMCLGYEERSFSLWNSIAEKVDNSRMLFFTMCDYPQFDRCKSERIKALISENAQIYVEDYESDIEVKNTISDYVLELQKAKENVTVIIDYSSMPRSWYCKLPFAFSDILREKDKVVFAYFEGKYEEGPSAYKTVGVDSYKVFAGKASIITKAPRVHLIGVGYDAMRTQGVLSILDPENYLVCEAFDPEFGDVKNKVEEANASIIEQTTMSLQLHITDMEFMISKLIGIINELLVAGNSDVILVPDGPKPLIFAMSMIPIQMNKEGVVCIHIIRNNTGLVRKNVEANGKVVAFSVCVDSE